MTMIGEAYRDSGLLFFVANERNDTPLPALVAFSHTGRCSNTSSFEIMLAMVDAERHVRFLHISHGAYGRKENRS